METEIQDFQQFDLDSRLLRAIKKLGYQRPTLIQAKTIQLALEGKDILGKAKTGSGKTAAYCLPILHKLLKNKKEVSVRVFEGKLLIHHQLGYESLDFGADA